MPHFLALSIGLHLAMTGLWHFDPTPSLGIPTHPLQITLEKKQAKGSRPIQSAAAKHRAPRRIKKIPHVQKTPPVRTSTLRGQRSQGGRKTIQLNTASKSFTQAQPASPHAKDATPNRHDASFSGIQTQANASRVSAAVKRRLAAYFEYPSIARRRGWEGEVMLSLHLDSDGTMSNVKVAHSSGYRILDRSAVRSAISAKQVPEAVNWLAGKPFDMVVPVQYRLIGS